METRNKDLVLRMNQEVWNNGNLDNLEGLFSEDFVAHFLPDGTDTRGLDELREHVRSHRQAFPDWSEQIDHIIAEGEYVAIRYISTGTNTGAYLGKPATGKEVRISEMCIFRIEDDKIAEQWLLPDLLSLKQQLGLISQ